MLPKTLTLALVAASATTATALANPDYGYNSYRPRYSDSRHAHRMPYGSPYGSPYGRRDNYYVVHEHPGSTWPHRHIVDPVTGTVFRREPVNTWYRYGEEAEEAAEEAAE